MAQAQYPYLDLTVLDDVRTHIIAPNAALLFSRDLSRLLWANGEGASLIGADAIRPAIEGEFDLNPAMARQIRAAVDKLDHSEDVSAIMRVRSGFKTKLVGFTARLLDLPDGAQGVFLLTESLRPRTHTDADMASVAVEALDGYSHASAIIGAEGQILARSRHFDSLGVKEDDLIALVQEVATEDDRLVKRPIDTEKGAMPTGIARVSDAPASHLLVIASTNPADDNVQDDTTGGDADTPEKSALTGAVAASAVGAIAASAASAGPVDKDTLSDADGETDAENGAEVENAPRVGAFSSKRGKLPSGAFSRWYFNAKTADEEASDEEVSGDEPEAEADARGLSDELEPTADADISNGSGDDEASDDDSVEFGTVAAGVIGGAVGALGGAGAAVATTITDLTDAEDMEEVEDVLERAGLVQEDLSSSETDGSTSDSGDSDFPAEKDAEAATTSANDGADGAGFAFTSSNKPTRFVWEMDGAGVFVSVSDELAGAVGPTSADIKGLSWAETSQLRGFQNGHVITALLEKGDTWSGKTVMWPVDGTDMRVPVDLAGLPSYNRDRQFNGFNGFGLVRTADAVVDPELLDRGRDSEASDSGLSSVGGSIGAGAAALGAGALASTGLTSSDDSDEVDASDGDSTSEKVVDLRNRIVDRAGRSGRDLSNDEREAFDEIAEKLSSSDGESDAKAASEGDAQHVEPGAKEDATEDESVEDVIPSAFVAQPDTSSEMDEDEVDADASTGPTEETVADDPESGVSIFAAATAGVAGISGAAASGLVGADDGEQAEDDAAEQAEIAASDDTVRTPSHDVDTSILARLPIPVLVYRKDDLLFGNDEFFDVTGYADLQSLANSGGVEALFGASSALEESQQAHIFHRSGDRLPLRAHIQRVPWDSDKAMLLTLREDDGDDDRDDDGDDDGGDPDGRPNGDMQADSGTKDVTSIVSEKGDGDVAAADSTDEKRPRLSLVTTDGAAIAASAAGVAAASVSSGTSEERRSNTEAGGVFGGLDAEDLRGIVDTATDGVVIVSNGGDIRAMNRSAEALFDCEADTVIGQPITDLLAPESHRLALDYLSGMNGTGVASLLNDGREVIGRTSGGGLIPLFMAFGKLQSTDACCAVLRDITSWKKAEEELLSAKALAENASTQKTDFLATISHEIRTPLNAIIGFSDMMIEERFGRIDNDRYRGYLRDISRSGNHVLELINDLLDISKIEAGKMELEFDACDLNTIVSETVALTQPEANKERVIIRTSLSAVVPKVVADQRSLRQIILNLVSNSIKFTKSGGQVIISTVYDEAGEVVLRVRDTGVGMSELDLARALKPFEQVGRESASGKTRGLGSGEGTGLGLPLTKAMVEANRASFQIESKLDEGTLVEIHFPSQRVLADR